MPQTNREWPRLAAASINKMETIVLGHLKGQSDELWGFINVSERVLTEPPGALAQLGEWSVVLERRQPNYEAAGGDYIGIDFPHPTVMLEALSTPNSPVVSAARELNLRLMRRGQPSSGGPLLRSRRPRRRDPRQRQDKGLSRRTPTVLSRDGLAAAPNVAPESRSDCSRPVPQRSRRFTPECLSARVPPRRRGAVRTVVGLTATCRVARQAKQAQNRARAVTKAAIKDDEPRL